MFAAAAADKRRERRRGADEDSDDEDVVAERELLEGVTERTVAALRKLAQQGLITREQKRRLLTDVIRHHQQVICRRMSSGRVGVFFCGFASVVGSSAPDCGEGLKMRHPAYRSALGGHRASLAISRPVSCSCSRAGRLATLPGNREVWLQHTRLSRPETRH